MNEKIRGGIDPGKDGFIAVFVGDLVYFYPMPLLGNEYDIVGFQQIIGRYRHEFHSDIHFCVENVHAFHQAGATSNFSFGGGVMLIASTLTFYQIPFTRILPSKWQKVEWEGVTVQTKPAPKNISGIKVDTKATSEIAAQRLFPEIDLRATVKSKKPHEGKVDALLIADYCRRTYL